MQIALSTNSLVKTYGSGPRAVHALQAVSLDIAEGEIFSLLGPNGAGKTTLIKCLLGVVFANGGSASILGHPLASVKAKEHIGYLPENHKYPAHLKGRQVLDYFGKLSGIKEPKLSRRIDETLATVGMSDWADTKVQKYSKGMMQRLGLAQALINDPALLILDEPTDGVDPVGRKEIREVLLALKSIGKTVLMNSHLLSEVERISDRVAIMDHGKIIRDGTISDLTIAQDIYQIQLKDASDHVLAGLTGLRPVAAGGQLEFACHSVEELNGVIDELRRRGALIESLTPKKGSLEDLFVDLIQKSNLARQ
jgi:ABC-2 type transport system ATP-binding protein